MPLVADYGLSSDESGEEVEDTPDLVKVNGVQAKNTSGQSEDVLEDFVKKTNYGDAPIEKPPPKPTASDTLSKMRLPAVKTGKIQISIPSIQDSDSDDDQPKPKKTKSSLGAAGFLGSLPAPRASAGGKEAGRSFIPYTLTKQKPATTKPVKNISSKTKLKTSNKQTSKLTEEYCDSDDEAPQVAEAGSSGNFFSLVSDSEPADKNIMGSAYAPPSVVSNIPQNSVYTEDNSTQPRITAASLYNMTGDMEQGSDYPQDSNYEQMDYSADQSQIDNLLQDEQFLRLQGKKQRGKETIEFIDVHTDDQKVSEVELTKNISQEVDPSAFAHRKKGEGPSGQEKRKHQITYLAFQAKERELELKNTWAANRASKQQTQAKYGF